MPSGTLLVSAAFLLVNALIYVHIADRFRRTDVVNRQARLARTMFATWWYAIAATAITTAIPLVLAYDGVTTPAIHVALLCATLALLSVALCGLLYYLIYLFAGQERALGPLAAVYSGFFVFALFYVLRGGPVGVDVERWSADLVYQTPLPDAFRLMLFALIVLPQIGGAIAYGALLFRTRDAERRYRIALVASGIVIWSLCTLGEGIRVRPDDDAFQVTLRALSVGAILLVLAAYRPPAFIRERLRARRDLAL